MKFPFVKKADAVTATPKPASKAILAPKKPSADNGQRLVITGLIFISIAFVGVIVLMYLLVNTQSAKETQIREMKQDLVLARTEKDLVSTKADQLQAEIGRVIDLDSVVSESRKVNSAEEVSRKQGSMWINRKTQSVMVTLGVLNGVTKGSELSVYDGQDKLGTVKIVSALDVVSYAEPVDKNLKDFTKDYYAVKTE